MSENQTPITLITIWGKSIESLKNTASTALPTVVLLFIVPIFVATLGLALIGSPVVTEMREVTLSLVPADEPDFREMIKLLSGFIQSTMLIGFVVLCFLGIGYFATVEILSMHLRQGRLIDIKTALRAGFSRFFPNGLIMAFVIALISLEQFLFGPIRIFTMFALVAPVILTLERPSLRAALGSALTLRYVQYTRANRFSIALILVSLGALLFFAESFIQFVTEGLLHLDESMGIARTFWSQNFIGLPFSPAFLIVKIVELSLYGSVIAFTAAFTTNLFWLLRPSFQQKA